GHQELSPNRSGLIGRCAASGDFIQAHRLGLLAGGAQINVVISTGEGAGVVHPFPGVYSGNKVFAHISVAILLSHIASSLHPSLRGSCEVPRTILVSLQDPS